MQQTLKCVVAGFVDKKVEIFEEDGEFEELEIEDWDDQVGDKEATPIWDDNDVSDDFSQLRLERS